MKKPGIHFNFSGPIRHPGRILFLTAGLTGILIWGALISAPLLLHGGAGERTTARALYLVFAPFCHQMPDHCFHLGGFPLPVCARCTGFYAGFYLGLLAFAIVRRARVKIPSPRPLLAGAAILAIEWILTRTGLIASSNLIRFITGLAAALPLAGFLVPALCILAVRHPQQKVISCRKLPAKSSPPSSAPC